MYEVEDDTRLPFGNAEFDLVINRHESYEPAEVRRILHPGGRFVTQQVGGQNNTDLNALLGAPEVGDSYWDLAHARHPLEDAGFEVREGGVPAHPLRRRWCDRVPSQGDSVADS